MDRQQLFVKMALQAWETHNKRTTTFFNSLTDEQLLSEIAPGKNRVVYLLGHLTAVHDMMLPILGLGERNYPQLDNAFVSNPDKAVDDIPSATDLKTYWTKVTEQLWEHFNRLSPDEWFRKHTLMSDEDYVKEPHRNRLSVLINRTNHLSYHLGQLVLVRE